MNAQIAIVGLVLLLMGGTALITRVLGPMPTLLMVMCIVLGLLAITYSFHPYH